MEPYEYDGLIVITAPDLERVKDLLPIIILLIEKNFAQGILLKLCMRKEQ